MNHNISGINIYQKEPIQIIANQIWEILHRYYNQENLDQESTIEIEYKFAEFKNFCNSNYVKPIHDLNEIKQQTKAKILSIAEYYVIEQSRMHLETLSKISNFSMVLLNPLGRRVYDLFGSFNEFKHKKFYKMREFLINLCESSIKTLGNKNYYIQLRKINNNQSFRLIDQAEMRLDINIKGGQNEGRYSYLKGKGWTRTRKINLLRQQFDILIKQKPFRLAAKKEEEIVVTNEEMSLILNSLSSKTVPYIRIKRALKVVRNDIVEYSLSQIYQPNQQVILQYISDIKDMLFLEPVNLQNFCISAFQRFYVLPEMQQKYEIECEFTKKGIKHLHVLQKSQKYRDFVKEIQKNIGDMFALFFIDHTIKMKESIILDEMNQSHSQSNISLGNQLFPQARLQNQLGSYMHDIIAEYMKP